MTREQNQSCNHGTGFSGRVLWNPHLRRKAEQKGADMNRREFFNQSVWLTAGAAMASTGFRLSAQTRGTPVGRPDRYDDSLILERKAFAWPGGKTLAIWIIPNVEIWDFQ